MKLRIGKISGASQETFCSGNIPEVTENISAHLVEVPFLERTNTTFLWHNVECDS